MKNLEQKDTENNPVASVSYGLNLRRSNDNAATDSGNYGRNSCNGGGSSIEAIIGSKFKSHMDRLPEDQGFDEYQDTAVVGFAEALLAGYGWQQGRGIGRNNVKGDVKVIEHERRTGRDRPGLGFMMADDPPTPKIEGSGIRRNAKRDVKVVECKPRIGNEKPRFGFMADDPTAPKVGEDDRVQQREEKSGSGKRRTMWLMSHIKVSITSKEFEGGRFYLKTGEVVDVIGPGICDLSMDDGGKIVQEVDQDILEAALPNRGGSVVVLLGKHKGVYGKLVDDSEEETCLVQDVDSQEMFRVRPEDIAEFVGDPSYLGY